MTVQRKSILIIIISIISLASLTVYGVLYGEHSDKSLNDILTVELNNVTKIELSNLTGNYRSTVNEDEIHAILNYLDQFQYKRLLNDQTAYMPRQANIIYIYEHDESNFIVPYGHEAMINYKVYQIKGGNIEQAVLLEIFDTLDDKSHK